MRFGRSIMTLALAGSLHISAAASVPESSSTEVDQGRFSIVFGESIEFHPAGDDMTSICRAGYEVKGCTDFPIERLVCDCEKRGGFWMINAVAGIEAVIHIPSSFPNARTLVHELHHIADLKASLRAHMEMLTSKRYTTERSCRRFARFLTESQHLRVVMNGFRVESNEKYGCSRRASRQAKANRNTSTSMF